MRGAFLTILLCAAVALFGCGGGDDSTTGSGEVSTAASSKESTVKPNVKVPSGEPPTELVVEDLSEGEGAEAQAGDEVTVHYVGVGYQSKEEFDSSWVRGEPFTFTLGAGNVIPGWEEGIVGMKEGGQRQLIVPPELAYGSQGAGTIAPNETLIFVVDLIAVS